jgi:hypothetical protein
MVGFGFGASFVALFAQLGGGIFTKVHCCYTVVRLLHIVITLFSHCRYTVVTLSLHCCNTVLDFFVDLFAQVRGDVFTEVSC